MDDADFDLLQRYHDGALEPDAIPAVEARIESDPEWAEAVRAMRITGEMVQAEVGGAVAAAHFDGLWAAVEAELPARAPAASVSRRAAPTPEPTPEPIVESFGARLRAWWADNWTPVLASAAAAALVAVVVVRTMMPASDAPTEAPGDAPAPPPTPVVRVPTDAPTPAPKAAPEAAPKLVPVGHVVVDWVRNEGDDTVIINTPKADDGATVIWLLEDEDEGATPPHREDPI
jgi:hypothetical protein